ncbi:hypothetical protein [Weissella minor]|uniref:hypothetical protein n=1 Tax=Weissella minor TaxID=1620 RepID=UPI003AF1EF40
MLINLLPTLISFPGDKKLEEWNDSWENTLKFWSTAGEKAKGVGSTKNEVINFFISNQPYLEAWNGIFILMSGYVQNVIYKSLYFFAQATSGLMKAALTPLYYLPKMLMDPHSVLHVLFYICISVAISLTGLGLLLRIPSLTKKQGGLSKGIGNSFFTIGMMFLLPFFVAFAGEFTQKTLSEVIDGGGNKSSSIAAAPMVNNTVDVEQWALDGFEKTPFSRKAPIYNNLEEADNPIPDFTNMVDKDDVKLINEIAKSNGNFSNSKQTETKNVGKAFQYSPRLSPKNDNENRPQYSLDKLSLDKGWTHIGDKYYKRFKVQNFPAIASFLIFIFVGALFAIKVTRSTIGAYTNMLASVVANGRDTTLSVETTKKSIMEIFNSFMAIFLDVFMLILFNDLAGKLPNQIASDYSGLMRGLVYVMVLGVLAIMTFNGSSAIERQFGMTAGAHGQVGSLRALGMPGALLGSMAGGMLSDKMRDSRHKKALEKMNQDDNLAATTNYAPQLSSQKGEEAAKLLSEDGQDENNSQNGGTNLNNGPSTNESTKDDGGLNNTEDLQKSNSSSMEASGDNAGEEAARKLDDVDETTSDYDDQTENSLENQDASEGEAAARLLDDTSENEVGDSGDSEIDSAAGEDAAELLNADYDESDEYQSQDATAGENAVTQLNADDSSGANPDLNSSSGQQAAESLDRTDDGADDDSEIMDAHSLDNQGSGEAAAERLNNSDGDQTYGTNNDMGTYANSDMLSNMEGTAKPQSSSRMSTTRNQHPTNKVQRTNRTSQGNRYAADDTGRYVRTNDVQDMLRQQEKQTNINSRNQQFKSQDEMRRNARKRRRAQRVAQALQDIDQAEDPNKPV